MTTKPQPVPVRLIACLEALVDEYGTRTVATAAVHVTTPTPEQGDNTSTRRRTRRPR